jgi:hypothetical protein
MMTQSSPKLFVGSQKAVGASGAKGKMLPIALRNQAKNEFEKRFFRN